MEGYSWRQSHTLSALEGAPDPSPWEGVLSWLDELLEAVRVGFALLGVRRYPRRGVGGDCGGVLRSGSISSHKDWPPGAAR